MHAEGIDTPVIVISGYASASFVQDGMALGAEFLSKPIDLEKLESVVKSSLAGAQPKASVESPPSGTPSAPLPDRPPGDTF
jgi:YesN/AraC family two-component response regulator